MSARRLEPLFCHTVGKDDGGNDDRCRKVPRRGCYAVSDGASESFDPGGWAEFLSERFLAAEQMDERGLAAACHAYAALHDRDAMTWSRQAAYDRGSFATLLGVNLHPSGRRATITAVGDSVALLLSNGSIRDAHPYASVKEFEQNPLLLSTVMGKNASILDRGFTAFRRDWDLTALKAPMVMCMTDALGAWALDKPSRAALLCTVRGKGAFKKLVRQEQAAGSMRRDDVTLLVLGRRPS